MVMPSLIYQVKELFCGNLAIGKSRHQAKRKMRDAGKSVHAQGERIHSWGTFHAELQPACQFVRFTHEVLGVKRLDQLTREHVLCYFLHRRIEVEVGELSPNTLAADLVGMRRLSTLLLKHGITPEQVVPDDLRAPREFRPRGAYTAIEAQQIIAYVDDRDPAAATVLMLQRWGGLRIHEAITLQTGWVVGESKIPTIGVDVAGGQVTVKGKGGRIRTVKLLATDVLTRLDLTIQFPLARANEKTWTNRIEALVRAAARKLHIQCRGTHGLRATAANHHYVLLRRQGLTEAAARLETAKFLGHNRTDVLRHYITDRMAGEFMKYLAT
jgi:integrase